jgi:outer membrane cobalamin receptor
VSLTQTENKKQDIRLKISAMTSQVVVSASLGAALLPQIGSSINVLNRQQIEDLGAQNIAEVLRGTPGTEITQTGRRGGMVGVSIRGGESNFNAILVDGIPMNQFGGEFYLESLPADGIDRVEVIRGSESALYGSNAMTGVINLISRKGEGHPQFTALAEGGSYDTRRFATGGSGLTGGLSWSYNLSRLDSEGSVVNDNYRNQSAVLSLAYNRKHRQVSFNFFGNADDVGDPGAYGSDPLGLFYGISTSNRVKQNLFGYQVNYSEQITSRIRQITNVSLSTNKYRYLWESYGYSGITKLDNLRAMARTRSEISISNTNMLTVGFEFNREQTRDNFYLVDESGNSFLLPRISLAYFAENRWSPSVRFNLTAGLRMDHLQTHAIPSNGYSRPFIESNYVAKINPRVSASYILREDAPDNAFGMTRLHGNFGTGIRPPSGYELGNTDNPSLKPERSLSFDAGVEQSLFSSRAIVDATYFQNRFEDLIVSLGGSLQNLSSYSSANLANSRTRGLELSFRLHPIQSLELSGQYTYLDSAILALDGTALSESPFEVGQQLLRRPKHAAGYNVTWRHGKLMLNTNASIRGTVLDVEPNWGVYACTYGMQCLFNNPKYVRANAGFSYRLVKGVELYGRINNFLNRKYEESFGYPALKLNFMAGMRFSIPSE